jgi:DNA-binding transcriptional MerR regulator
MNNSLQNHVTIKQAARIAGCSTKTLYRLMNRGALPYQQGENGRRHIDPEELRVHFKLEHGEPRHYGMPGSSTMEVKIDYLLKAIEHQSLLLERMISLYQPKTLKELATKQSSIHQSDK